MTIAKTSTQRKAEERQRHKKAGRVAVTVYVRPEFRAEVRILEAQLRRQEASKLVPLGKLIEV